MHRYRVLATNGGGTLGLYELCILAEIENAYCIPAGKTLRDNFDLIVGCSRGALTASAIAKGVPLATMINPLKAVASHIFPKDSNAISKAVRLVKTASGDAYDYRKMRDVCKYFLGDSTMKDIPKKINLCLIAYCLEQNAPRVFSSHDPEDEKLYLTDVTMASCSIPTGFPPYKIGDMKYCDGFPYADDSALYAQCRVIDERRGPYVILSVDNIVQKPKESCGTSLLNGDHINAMVQMTTQCAFLRSRKIVEKLCSLTDGLAIHIPCREFATATTVVYNNSEPEYLEDLVRYATESYTKFAAKSELSEHLFQTSDT